MKFTLVDKKAITDGVTTFIFEPPEDITWEAGQYMHYVLDHKNTDNRGHERWFTISSPPFEKHPAITTRFTAEKGSSFKKALDNMKLGDQIEADGVEGDFVINDSSKQYIFIVGGIGITPFHSILRQLDHNKKPINVDLMYANRDHSFPFDNEFQTIAKRNPNFRIHKFADPKRIEEADIKAVAQKLDDPQYYVSGPWPMVDAFDKLLKTMGIADGKIHNDDFPGYETI